MKSKGPTSPEGRAKVARNALKHGLTGEGIVVPDEDVAAIQDRFEDFNANLNPLGVVSEFLIRHLALQSVRMDRYARQEAASLTRQMLLAEQTEADAHRAALQDRVDHLAEDPEAALRELQRSPRGIAWLITAWEDLKESLFSSSRYQWNSTQIERAENLTGNRYSSPYPTRIGILSNAYHGNLDALKDWPDMPAADRQQAAREELGRIMDAEIARLKEVLEKIDRDKLAKIESGAMARALFDASKEAVLARKYAAAAERGFYKALKTIQELNASSNADIYPEIDDITPEPETESAELALNFPGVEIVEGPPKRRPPAPADRRKSKARRVDRDPRRLKS